MKEALGIIMELWAEILLRRLALVVITMMELWHSRRRLGVKLTSAIQSQDLIADPHRHDDGPGAAGGADSHHGAVGHPEEDAALPEAAAHHDSRVRRMQLRMEQADLRFKEAMEPLSAMYRSLIVAHGLQRDEMDQQRMQLLSMERQVFRLDQEVRRLAAASTQAAGPSAAV